jgi:hypothetical protein
VFLNIKTFEHIVLLLFSKTLVEGRRSCPGTDSEHPMFACKVSVPFSELTSGIVPPRDAATKLIAKFNICSRST